MGIKVTRIATSSEPLSGGSTLDASYSGTDVDVVTGLPLDNLLDVDAAAPDDGDVLTWDDGTGTWIAAAGGGGPDVELVTVAATGAAETVDVSVARTYDLTMDADVTLTLTGAVNAEAWFVTLFLRQDGTGGWDVTWPGSVVWATGTAPTIDPDPNAVTVVTLGTLDGGTTWYGFPTGGGGTGTGLDVELVTVVSSGAAETIDVSVARTYDVTLTSAPCVLTLTGSVDAEAWFLTLLLRQDGVGNRTVTWPAEVTWIDGTAPVLATAAGDVDIITLLTVDGGAQWIGAPGQGGGGPTVAALDDLTDVNAPSPSDGDVLAWDVGASEWVPVPAATAATISALGFVGELVVADGTTGPPVNTSAYVEEEDAHTTTSALLEDIPDVTTTITLQQAGHIAIWLNTQISGSGVCVIGIAVNIDGTDHDEMQHAIGGSDAAALAVVHRTSTPFASGTYTIKGRMRRVSGASTPSVDRADLFVMTMAHAGPVLVTTEDETDYLYADV